VGTLGGEHVPYRTPGSAWGVAVGDRVTVFLNGGDRVVGALLAVDGRYLDVDCVEGRTRVATNQIAAIRGVAPR